MVQKRAIMGIALMVIAGLLSVPGVFSQESVRVGSKIDTEGAVLGQMIILMLQENKITTEDKTEFGPTPIVRKALIAGEIDIYPEYTGNGAFFFSGQDATVWKDHEKAYAKVKELDARENGLVWLNPARANNTWAIALRNDMAEKENLTTLEDLARYINDGGNVKLAACEEFVSRDDALPSFEKAYGFDISDKQMIVFSGCNTAQTEQAAAQGINEVNAAMAFGTDGALAALGLRVLEDPKGVQPVYAPAPLIRKDVLSRYPEIEGILEKAFASLDQQTLQELNARVAMGGENAQQVARDHLEKKGLLKE